MRCLPRRKKLVWISFLLFACLVGVYLSYNGLLDSKGLGLGRTSLPYNPRLERSHKRLREKTQAEIQRAKAESRIGNKEIQVQPKIDDEVPQIDGNAAVVGLRALENDDDYITPDEMMARLKLLLIDLTPTNWKTALDVEDMMLQVKSELYDLGIDSQLTCKEIIALKPGGFHYRSHYGKKSVERMQVNYYKSVIVKSPGKDTQLKVSCMQMDYNEKRCSVMANYKVMRELVYLLALKSPSIVQLKGYCLRGETIDPRLNRKGVMIVTEAGEETMVGTLVHFPRNIKLEITVELLKLLIYMDTSPVGSLGFDQLHIQDFVIFGTSLKLVDLDNIHIGEVPCVEDKDCRIPETSGKEIRCQNNVCKGRNAKYNLLWLKRVLLRHLLLPTAKKYENEVPSMLDSIDNLEVTASDLLEKVYKWKENGDTNMLEARDMHQSHRIREPDSGNLHGGERKQDAIRQINKDKKNAAERQGIVHRPVPQPTFRPLPVDKAETRDGDQTGELVEYIREDHSNYPAVMTAVFKNNAKGKPDSNKGATLFSKKKSRERSKDLPGDKNLARKDVSMETVKPPTQTDIQDCTKVVLNQTSLGRTSREKRLMTHLGLKGISESEWIHFAKSVKIVRSQGLSQMSHKLVTGARLKVVYETNGLGLKKGEFLLEKGPTHHHISLMIAYHLDRTLGLYHVPTAVGRVLSWNDIQVISGDKKFQELYTKFNQSEGIHGVLTLPVPPVMKTDKITISNRETIATSIIPYTRAEKSQLEYILIWALMKFTQPSHGFLGYKGHLIHFEADVGFGNMKKSMQGYFFNCQFPNSVFKTLLCYKCTTSHKLPKICGLGHEVMKRVKESGFLTEDIQIGKYSEKTLTAVLDNNAATVLTAVEHCIKTFSREKVLY